MSGKSSVDKSTTKLAVGIGGLIFLLNLLLMGVFSQKGNQQKASESEPATPVVKEATSPGQFVFRDNKIFYHAEIINLEEFKKRLDACKGKNIHLGLIFYEKTIQLGFKAKIIEIVKQKKLWPCTITRR